MDITDEQWKRISKYLPQPKSGPRQRMQQQAELKTMKLSEEEISRAMAPFESFHLQLEEEVQSYERMKRGEFAEMENLRGLGDLLIACCKRRFKR